VPLKPPTRPKEFPDTGVDWVLLIKILLIFVLWSLAVMNTELLIKWSHFMPPDGAASIWQFGQIFPLFIVILPLATVAKTYKELGFRRRYQPVSAGATEQGLGNHP